MAKFTRVEMDTNRGGYALIDRDHVCYIKKGPAYYESTIGFVVGYELVVHMDMLKVAEVIINGN